MNNAPTIKICGLSTPQALAAALDAGADMVGFVFFPPSPRNISFDVAKTLGAQAEGLSLKVALTVDGDDALFEKIMASLQPDILQLHGTESPARLIELKARFGMPLMKAIHISEDADLSAIADYEAVADFLLFDARPPEGAELPGGNGEPFDWKILDQAKTSLPWMLSGGLDASNVAEALRTTHAPGVDVSSGVESAPGVKDPELIESFIAEVYRAVLEVGLGSGDESA